MQLRAFDGRMTVTQRAAHIAVYLELARELDTRDAQSEGVSPDLCAWDATVIQAADACREVAVMLGQATVELAAVRNTVRRCLSAISSCGDICGPHKEATASCARRVDIAKRGARLARTSFHASEQPSHRGRTENDRLRRSQRGDARF